LYLYIYYDTILLFLVVCFFRSVVMYVQYISTERQAFCIRHLTKLNLQDGKAPKVRGRFAEKNPVLT